MSEVKRAKLISFGAQRANDKNSKEIGKTVRISVILPESTEDKCPEFNYKDELVAAKRKGSAPKNSTPKQTNGLDPFTEDDEDVKRIAAEMEAKYGIGVAKKRKWRKDDYADIGMGYDESDSFIDNTDGYDEIIPKNVTTLHGGFYINCGALEFKTDEDISSEESSSSDEEDTPEKSASRKRILESSADSEEETQTDNPEKIEQPEKKPKLVNTNGMQKAIKKRLFSHDKIKQQMRKKRPDETNKKTVRELLKERRLDLNMTPVVESEPPEKTEPALSPKENKKPAALASVDDVIESVISSAVKMKDEPVDESSKDSSSSKDAAINKPVAVVNSSEADSNDGISIKPVEIVQLPENLPKEITDIIESIKNAAACSTEGKVKFFTDPVNKMLLNLERSCRCLGKQSRMRVYEHLAPFVKCRKETLMKRAKNVCIAAEQSKLIELMKRLKAAVGSIMPTLVSSYEEECRTVLQRNQQTWEWYRCAWFSVNSEEATKNLRMPKRHFCWTEESKKLLRDIIAVRKKCYIIEGKQKDSLERHLTEFIRSEIHGIWPEGWMSMSTLLKCCNIVPDVKKNIDPPKKATPTSSPEINISPSPSITVSPAPSIPISANSALTITPVTTNVHKVNSNEVKMKPKPLTLSETVISKVNSDNCSITKPSMPLPPADIVKTSPPELNNVKFTTSASNSNKTVLLVKEELDTIVIEESPIKKDQPENLSSHVNVIKHEPLENSIKEKNSVNHCQVIDLTDQPELKKRPGPKSKTKYLYEYPDKSQKLKKDHAELLRIKSKEEITGSSALTQIIADSLSDLNRFAQSTPKSSNSTVINNTASVNNPSDSAVKKLSGNVNSSYDYTKAKLTSEGDDIQKVMEGLKVLQKMSSPVKSNDEVKTSSPVSVIAFSKSYSHESGSSPHNATIAAHRSNSFQDAFQKHFIPDYNNLMKASQAASTSKGNYNSISKHNHTSTKSNSTSSDRYLQNSNNNYAQQNSNKLKNSCSSQQSGSYDLLDDMFANFLNEYGHSKTAMCFKKPKVN